MNKLKLNHWICLASLLAVAPGYGSDLEAKFRGSDTRQSFAKYSDRPDLGLLKPINVQQFFSGVSANSAVASEISGWSQESLEQLYSQLSSGPIPKSDGGGEILFNGIALTKAEGVLKRIAEIFPTPPPAIQKVNDFLMTQFVELLWHGKKFIPQPGKLVHVLVNRIGNDPLIAPLVAQLQGEESVEASGGTKVLGGGILGRLGQRLGTNPSGDAATVGGEKFMMPAKVYCGESLLDTRKESIIIDYAYSEDVLVNGHRYSNPGDKIPPHRAMVNRHGLNIRDEIRMIRPGLYLGRAYVQSAFVLHFILHKDSGFSGDADDECRNPYKPATKISSL